MRLEKIIAEVREAKQCLLAGQYEMSYEKMQNVDDELTTMLIRFNEIFAEVKDVENWK